MTLAVRHLVAQTHIFYGSEYVGDKSLAAVLYQVGSFCRILILCFTFPRNPYRVLERALFCFFPHSSDPSAGPCCKSLQLKIKVPRINFLLMPDYQDRACPLHRRQQASLPRYRAPPLPLKGKQIVSRSVGLLHQGCTEVSTFCGAFFAPRSFQHQLPFIHAFPTFVPCLLIYHIFSSARQPSTSTSTSSSPSSSTF